MYVPETFNRGTKHLTFRWEKIQNVNNLKLFLQMMYKHLRPFSENTRILHIGQKHPNKMLHKFSNVFLTLFLTNMWTFLVHACA